MEGWVQRGARAAVAGETEVAAQQERRRPVVPLADRKSKVEISMGRDQGGKISDQLVSTEVKAGDSYRLVSGKVKWNRMEDSERYPSTLFTHFHLDVLCAAPDCEILPAQWTGVSVLCEWYGDREEEYRLSVDAASRQDRDGGGHSYGSSRAGLEGEMEGIDLVARSSFPLYYVLWSRMLASKLPMSMSMSLSCRTLPAVEQINT